MSAVSLITVGGSLWMAETSGECHSVYCLLAAGSSCNHASHLSINSRWRRHTELLVCINIFIWKSWMEKTYRSTTMYKHCYLEKLDGEDIQSY